MHVICLIGRHQPLPATVHNQGFQFSRCRCCGRDMISSGRSWRRVPKGFRVVWKRSARSAASSSASARSLPGNDLSVFARRPRGGMRTLAGIADLVRAALRVLLWAWHDRLNGVRLWMRALPARPGTPLRLPPA